MTTKKNKFAGERQRARASFPAMGRQPDTVVGRGYRWLRGPEAGTGRARDGRVGGDDDGDGDDDGPRTARMVFSSSAEGTESVVPVAVAAPDRRSAEAGTYRTHHRRRRLRDRGSMTAQRLRPPLPPSTGRHWQWLLCRATCRWRARWLQPPAAPWPRTSGLCIRHTATPWRSFAVCPSSAGFETTPEIINRECALSVDVRQINKSQDAVPDMIWRLSHINTVSRYQEIMQMLYTIRYIGPSVHNIFPYNDN